MLKRFLDIVISATALILLSPLFLIIAYQVRKKSRDAYFISSDAPWAIW